MIRTRLLAIGTLLAASACGGDSLAPSGPGPRYLLRTVNQRPVPALARTDSSRRYFGYVDSGSVELVDDTSGFIAFAMHEVVYLDNGDSLTGGWLFRVPTRVELQRDRLILDYRSRTWGPVRYDWEFTGVDTVLIGLGYLVILGDSLLNQPRTVYRYTGE
jgi:hypothetical protein